MSRVAALRGTFSSRMPIPWERIRLTILLPPGPGLLVRLVYLTGPAVALMSRYKHPEPLRGLPALAAVYFVISATAQNQFATQRPITTRGGWLGEDPAPTLDQDTALTKDQRVSYVIWLQPVVDEMPPGSDAVAITDWAQANFKGEKC